MQTIIKKTIILLLVAAVLSSFLGGCSKKEAQPEDTIWALQDAINDLDVDNFLACIDSQWASQIEMFLSLSGKDNGYSIETFITLLRTVMPVLPFVSKGTVHPDDFPQVEFTVLNTDISNDTATVALSGILTWGEHIKPFAANVDMKIENNRWVVCGVS